MTRTERSAFPRAVLKDRSISRSGFDKSVRKDGGGPHNWGRLGEEAQLEFAALDDESYEFENDTESNSSSSGSDAGDLVKKPTIDRSSSSPTQEELQAAKQFRKHALKGQIDLAAIARTSGAVSTSPITSEVHTSVSF